MLGRGGRPRQGGEGVGPGVTGLGAAIGSGEFLPGPAVLVRHGLSLLRVTPVAVFLQTVFDTELMRYTTSTTSRG